MLQFKKTPEITYWKNRIGSLFYRTDSFLHFRCCFDSLTPVFFHQLRGSLFSGCEIVTLNVEIFKYFYISFYLWFVNRWS